MAIMLALSMSAASIGAATEDAPSYTDIAATCIATLIEKGTDRYGETHSPIWVLNLDLETMDCFPAYNDRVEELQRDFTAGKLSLYSPVVPYGTGHRVIRVSQRPAGCSNLFVDQPMMRAAVLHDLLQGEKRFAPAIEAYVEYYLTHFMDQEAGLLEWGVHTSYNVFEEDFSAYDGRLHEVQTIPRTPSGKCLKYRLPGCLESMLPPGNRANGVKDGQG